MKTTKKSKRVSGKTAPRCSALPGQTKNPLFIEFYPHTKCDCYKINLPWTKYRCHTLILCDVAKGIVHAQRLARRAIAEHLDYALAEPMPNARPVRTDGPLRDSGTHEAVVGQRIEEG